MSAPRLRPDRKFLMLYTSFISRVGPAVLASYGPDAQAIGVGSTGGGIDAGGGPLTRTLTWEELARDLRIARRYTDEIAIFSLEGCVQHEMLAKLESLDWNAAAPSPGPALAVVAATRTAIRGCLRLASHPRVAIAAALLALTICRRMRR